MVARMTTFSELLSQGHASLPWDFGSHGGDVAIDSNEGTVHPVGADGKTVALDQIFKAGHYVSLMTGDSETARLRFVVIGVNHDGIVAVSANGEEGFLPWEVMATAIRQSRKVFVDVLSELEEFDEEGQAFVREEIGRLTREMRRHRAIASELAGQLDKLESIGKRPAAPTPHLTRG